MISCGCFFPSRSSMCCICHAKPCATRFCLRIRYLAMSSACLVCVQWSGTTPGSYCTWAILQCHSRHHFHGSFLPPPRLSIHSFFELTSGFGSEGKVKHIGLSLHWNIWDVFPDSGADLLVTAAFALFLWEVGVSLLYWCRMLCWLSHKQSHSGV